MAQSPSSPTVGPVLGFVLLLVLCSAVLFAAWRFLEGGEAVGQVSDAGGDERTESYVPAPVELPSQDAVRIPPGLGATEPPPAAPSDSTRRIPQPRTPGGPALNPGTGTLQVSGRVRDQESGKPVVYFEVYLVPPSGDPLQAAEEARAMKHRNAEGDFTLRYLLEGTYDLVVKTLSHEPYVHPVPITVPLEGQLDIRLQRGTWISGAVRDTFGKPLEGLEVHLLPTRLDPGGKMPRRRLVRSGPTGYFEFSQLPTGMYKMFVGNRNDPDASHHEFYLGNAQHLDKSFEVERQTTLKFLLTNVAGKPVPRARVSLVSSNRLATRSNYSNIRGEATLPFVKPGKYILTIKAPGYQGLEESDYFVNRGDFFVEEERVLTIQER